MLAAFGGVVGGDGIGFAEAAGFDRAGLNSLLDEIIAHALGAVLGEILIVLVAAYAVGVALNGDVEAGIGEDNSRNFGEALAGGG